YEIEQTTDLWSLNSGRVQAKLGVNSKPLPEKSPVSFVLIDNRHLDAHGVAWFCARSDRFVLITVNPQHPAFGVRADNLHIILQKQLDLPAALSRLKEEYGCERLTIQSGGTLNALFLRQELIDYVDVIVAPVLIGGRSTPTLIDGEALHRKEELSGLGVLKLLECRVLEDSWLRLRYEVMKKG
ncbi:MAG: dihydrofolate reductase family protein, partial [Solobacterium sp.]|nr:dihydrofolate reductase family protein [Solobacterium sp.]